MNIYLTIDDAPSIHMKEKVDFLLEHKIPALFFCPGKNIEKHRNLVVDAIKSGFTIGNHSYSHPYFSEISEAECYDEILRTEVLIDECYALAKSARPAKLFRLPYGDRGTGAKAEAIQRFLGTLGFTPLKADGFLDTGWDWDTRDYKQKMILDPKAYLQGLEEHWRQSSLAEEVILLHDFDHNPHLFGLTMDFLMKKQVKFKA